MIEKLEQLTLSKFVDLVCGDTSVLLGAHEVGNTNQITVATRNIVFEYRTIADPGVTNSYFKHLADWIKAKISVIVFTICHNLLSLKQYDRVRDILGDYGLSASKWNDSRVEGTVKAKLSQAQRELDEMETENESAVAEREKIRSQFDTQTAALMAYFKFQIDPATIKATLYANLVARYNREIKAQMAVMKKN